MYTTTQYIFCFITEDNLLKIVEYTDGDYKKKIINNDILELAMTIACTTDKKLFINTINSETHILNLNDNVCEKISFIDNVDDTPVKIEQFFATLNTTITLIYTHKNIIIENQLRPKAIVDLDLEDDEIIIFAKLMPTCLLILTNSNTKIIEYDLNDNVCHTKNGAVKIIQKKYYNLYGMDEYIFFFSDNSIEIYKKNFIDYPVILSYVEIKSVLLFRKKIYFLEKTSTQWVLYCCTKKQQEKNCTLIDMNGKNYYVCKIFDELCEKIDIYQFCAIYGYYFDCRCRLEYIILVHGSTKIEIIGISSKTVTSYEMEYSVKNVVIVNCSNLIIVTNTHDLKYYEMTQDVGGKFIMNYRGDDEHRLKLEHKYSKKALHY